MPVNRNALIRYKTIDKCLQNRYRKWTLDNLIDACSDALYEYEGIDKGVSKRSIQSDIQIMRSDKLGYNAPIIVVDRKYYAYEEPDYSITNIPLTDQDLGKLEEAVEFMKQFQGFSHFKELDSMVQKLEDHIYSHKTHSKPAIDFEKNENLKGLEFLDALYQSIINKRTINITYQSFKARQASSFDFHPYLLKEFRNRWFIIGMKKKNEGILNLALDRILKVEPGKNSFVENPLFDAENHFKNAIGVSVSPTLEADEVLLYINRKHAPYVLTKPLHHSQKEVSRDNYGVTISLNVQHNFELEKEILGFGEDIKVISPERLKRNIKDRIKDAVDQYNTEINESGLHKAAKRLEHKGFSILNYVYTQREIRKISGILHKGLDVQTSKLNNSRSLLKKLPELKAVLLNKNLLRIIQTIDKNAFLTKAIYFEKQPQKDWYVSWHQDVPINVLEKKDIKGYSAWTQKEEVISVRPPVEISQNIFSIRIHLDDTDEKNGALKVMPGSHHTLLDDKSIQLITENGIPYVSEVKSGGIQIIKPLLLHCSSKITNAKKRRVIHLEFASTNLPDDLDWSEKEVIF